DDFIAIIRKLIELNNGTGEPDDIDHLGNRRVRAVGELLQNQFRMGLIRMERIIKERMTICDAATVTAASLINARPVVAAIKEFGFIETPFRRVYSEMPADKAHRDKLVGRTLRDDVLDPTNRKAKLAKKGDLLDRDAVDALVKAKAGDVPITAWVSDEIQFLSADEEDRYIVAQANAPLDKDSHFAEERTTARTKNLFLVADVNRIEYMDVS